MIRALTILTGIFVSILAFFLLLADAEPATVFYAQTAAALVIAILAVVLIASLLTTFYMAVFGKLADGFAKRRFSRFIGWKFLRSQRSSETRVSRIRRSWAALVARPLKDRAIVTGLGLLLLLVTLALGSPATWNTVADTISPSFATTLHIATLVLGALFSLVGLLALVSPKRPMRDPVLKQRSAVTLPTFISIVGVAIGLCALIVMLGVMHGLQSDLRDKILQTNAHLVVEPKDPDGVLPDPIGLERTIASQPGVVESFAFVRGEVMMSSPTSIAVNVVIKGMTFDALSTSDQLVGKVVDGSVLGLDRPETLLSDRSRYPLEHPKLRRPMFAPPTPGKPDAPVELVDPDLQDDIELGAELFEASADVLPGILMGAELARQLNVTIGEEVQLISPDGDVGPTGLRPKLASFRVAGVFQTGMYEYDQKLAYTALYAAQRFFDLGRDRNAFEARFSDPQLALDELDNLSALVAKTPGLTVSTFRDRNKNLFSALALERIIMLLILGFIVFVASLLIVSSLVMLVVEKVREIAVLKALGASDGSIVKSFMNIGAFIGLFGVLSGVPIGVGALLAIIAQGVTLPREFYITELPVKLDPVEIAIFGASAFAMCLLATLYPSRKASQLKPADGLRHG